MRRVLVAVLLALSAVGLAQPKFNAPDRIRYDGHCFTIDGKDTFIFSGAFHYFRCPQAEWRARFQSIKNAGFNAVETYVAWNWAERNDPKNPDSLKGIDLRDLDAWMTMAEDEFGLYTIVRPGPYICAEWAAGGFPLWLQKYKPAKPLRASWYRTDDPEFIAWSRHWFKAVAQTVDKHQLMNRPKGKHGMILWQVENEYDWPAFSDEVKRNYLKALIQASNEFGIKVPIFSCWTRPVRESHGDALLSQAFDNPNEYPRWNIDDVTRDIEAQHKAQPWAPKMVTEFQGGWFGNVGNLAAEEQDGISAAQINALTLNAIGNGLTGLNYYMLFGGTNFGDWAGEGVTTSYDYFAPIREWGGEGEKYRAVQAIGRMLQKYGSDLSRANPIETGLQASDGSVTALARRGPSGATYLFVRNSSRTFPAKGMLGPVPYVLPPFGMNVYQYRHIPSDGSWLVKPEVPKPVALPAAIRIKQCTYEELVPNEWKLAPEDATTDKLNVPDSRFIFYRATVSKGVGRYLWLKPAEGEIYCPNLPAPEARQSGQMWPAQAGATVFGFLNYGWPNGGAGMEEGHGVAKALLIDRPPTGLELTGWKFKTIADPKDRSLVKVGVDTTAWPEVKNNNFLPVHTWAVARANYKLDAEPNPKTILSLAGVDDEAWFYVNGQLVGEAHQYGVPQTIPVAKLLHNGVNEIAFVIHNNEGDGGLTGPVSVEMPLPPALPLKWEWTDKLVQSGSSFLITLDQRTPLPSIVHPHPNGQRVKMNETAVVMSRLAFPRPKTSDQYAWMIVLDAGGDGFLTFNHHPLGRFWESGPQRAYYLPNSWFVDGQNYIELQAMPGRLDDRIRAAELRPMPMKE